MEIQSLLRDIIEYYQPTKTSDCTSRVKEIARAWNIVIVLQECIRVRAFHICKT